MSIDERLLERRRVVAEGRASVSLRRILKLLAALGLAVAGVWVALSPWFSVERVRTSGVVSSTANQIMVAEDVVAGTPLVFIRTGALVAALESDPWIAQAQAYLMWPNEVVVRVVERVPVAWVRTQDGWTRRAIDGVALPSSAEPDTSMPTVDLPSMTPEQAATSPLVLGAIEFAAAIAHSYPDASVRLVDDELWAVVAGFDVRLGRSDQMEAKARSLEALLEERIPPGSVLILIAPTHPSVRTPQDVASE